ncbi:MAG TPA: diguanylate cyclase, partial [Allosphingosinicella sp.]|nr:diguanylate cyclase [Allosphingosinicella sp.]
YRALQRQIPLLYLIALANFVGLALTSGPTMMTLLHPANLLIALILVRLVHWVRTRKRELPPERILGELRKTLFLAGAFSLAAGFWATMLLVKGAPQQQELVILFASLAAIGCAYGLSSFPAAARLPLLLFALPFSAALMLSPKPAHLGVGISLALITLLVLRLVNLQNLGFVQLVRSRSDIETERERAQRAEQVALREKARANQVAHSDPLTGLANRRAFLVALEARLADPGGSDFALALIDLDGFKPINDTFGHAAGDSVLVEVSARLKRQAGAGALVARIGGDEFALILPPASASAAAKSAERVCRSLGEPYRIAGREFRISACCGLIVLRPGGCDVTAALVRADAALYRGKQIGRGCVAVFTPELQQATDRRSAIERALREPSVHDQIGVAYQPIFDLESGTLRAFEALARWTHPELGVVGPAEFIPITEQINVVEDIGGTVLARAAAEAASWPESVQLSFNLSAVELCSASSAARILQIAERHGLDPARLQIEVTETA